MLGIHHPLTNRHSVAADCRSGKSDIVAAPKSGFEITLTNLGILGLGGHFGTTVMMCALPPTADIFRGGIDVR